MDFGTQVGLQQVGRTRLFSKLRPRGVQEAPKRLPRAPQERPRAPQERPRAAQERPRATKTCPGKAQGVSRGYFFCAFLRFSSVFCVFLFFLAFFALFHVFLYFSANLCIFMCFSVVFEQVSRFRDFEIRDFDCRFQELDGFSIAGVWGA